MKKTTISNAGRIRKSEQNDSSRNDYKPKNIGFYGERVARYYLRSKSHTVIAKNLRLKCGEIDILSLKNNVIHIIEVKTACVFGDKDMNFKAEDNLSKTKLRKLHRLRGELSYWIESGQIRKFLNFNMFGDDARECGGVMDVTHETGSLSDLDIEIDGLAVDIQMDKASGAVSNIKVRHFPYL